MLKPGRGGHRDDGGTRALAEAVVASLEPHVERFQQVAASSIASTW